MVCLRQSTGAPGSPKRTPDFLSSFLAAHFMRLSLMKAAHAVFGGAPCRKSGYLGRKRWAKPNDRFLRIPPPSSIFTTAPHSCSIRFSRPIRSCTLRFFLYAHPYGLANLVAHHSGRCLRVGAGRNSPTPPCNARSRTLLIR